MSLVELVASNGTHPCGAQDLGRLAHRAADDLERRGALVGGVEREQRLELGGDACGCCCGCARQRLVEAGARVAADAPGVGDAARSRDEVPGKAGADRGDDQRRCAREVFECRVCVGRRRERRLVRVVGATQGSRPTRRSASAGSSTSPLTKGPNSAKRAETSSKRIS
jgi:hypothetical protein